MENQMLKRKFSIDYISVCTVQENARKTLKLLLIEFNDLIQSLFFWKN